MRSLSCAAAALLALWGCAAVRESRKIQIAPGTDMSRYQVFGVLPFGDDGGGRGKALAKDLRSALQERGLQVVDQALMEKEYRKARTDSFGLTLTGANELRERTKAEVMVTGAVTAKSYVLLVHELESGDAIVNVSFARRFGEVSDQEVRDAIMGYLAGQGPGEGPKVPAAAAP